MQTSENKLLTAFEYAVGEVNKLPDIAYLQKTIGEMIKNGKKAFRGGKTTEYRKELDKIKGITCELVIYIWNEDKKKNGEIYFAYYMLWDKNKAYQRILEDNRYDSKYKQKDTKNLFI